MNFSNLERIRDELVEKHGTVYTHVIDDTDVYFYKLLNKLEYEALCSNYSDELDLQDAIVYTCVLYPKNLDIDEMLPGDVCELAQIITSESCIMPDDRLALLEMYSEEMNLLDNMMCCLIMHAFPSYKLEDIEKMNFPEFYRLYTRAEWFIQNVLGEPLSFSAADSIKMALGQTTESKYSDYEQNGHGDHPQEPGQPNQSQTPGNVEGEGKYMGRNLNDAISEINNSNSKRKPMTEEQKAELARFQQQFPDIDMSQDAMYTGVLSQKSGGDQTIARRKY